MHKIQVLIANTIITAETLEKTQNLLVSAVISLCSQLLLNYGLLYLKRKFNGNEKDSKGVDKANDKRTTD